MNQNLDLIKQAIPTLIPKCGSCIVITIDGPAGSGKTTLAQELALVLGATYTVHMDDLYEGWDSTLTSKLTNKMQNLLGNLSEKSEIVFTPFDWHTNTFAGEIRMPAPKYLIIEGVGSAQSAIRNFISLALWIEVPAEEGLARVIKRDGPMVVDYMPAFLVAQNSHFAKEESKKSADYRLSGQGTV